MALKDGVILAQGAPCGIVDADLVTRIFDLSCMVVTDPVSGTPMIVVRGRHHADRVVR